MDKEVHAISYMEDATAEHISKLENKVEDLAEREGQLEKQIDHVEGKVVFLGWKFIG